MAKDRKITMEPVKLMSRIQEIHNKIVHMIGKRVDELDKQQSDVSSKDHHGQAFDEGYYKAIDDMRIILSQVELEPWQMEVQLKMLEVSLGE